MSTMLSKSLKLLKEFPEMTSPLSNQKEEELSLISS